MKNTALKEIQFNGITMQIPEVWKYEKEEYQEENGTMSYSLSLYGKGKDVRSIDINWGITPDGYDAYNGACATYIEVIGEEGLEEDDEPILSFDFQGKEAYGFNVFTEDGRSCFFFCTDIPAKGKNHLLTVLVGAANDNDLHTMVEFLDENLKVE